MGGVIWQLGGRGKAGRKLGQISLLTLTRETSTTSKTGRKRKKGERMESKGIKYKEDDGI